FAFELLSRVIRPEKLAKEEPGIVLVRTNLANFHDTLADA
ncbi:unnamed protein product, partial [marine sediment metagenome]